MPEQTECKLHPTTIRPVPALGWARGDSKPFLHFQPQLRELDFNWHPHMKLSQARKLFLQTSLLTIVCAFAELYHNARWIRHVSAREISLHESHLGALSLFQQSTMSSYMVCRSNCSARAVNRPLQILHNSLQHTFLKYLHPAASWRIMGWVRRPSWCNLIWSNCHYWCIHLACRQARQCDHGRTRVPNAGITPMQGQRKLHFFSTAIFSSTVASSNPCSTGKQGPA